MKKLFKLLIPLLVLAFVGVAFAIEYFPPPGPGKGVIGGQNDQRWGEGWFKALNATTLTVTSLAGIDTLTVVTDMTMPAKVHRIAVPLASVFVDGAGPITSATAPNLTTVDNVGAIVYDDSSETAEIHFPWVPDVSYSAMVVKLMVSSDDASGAGNAIDWAIFVQDDDTAFGTSIAQTGVSCTSASLDASNELLTLTLDATGVAAVTAGTSAVTVAVWNDSTSDDDLEIKKIWIEESRTK